MESFENPGGKYAFDVWIENAQEEMDEMNEMKIFEILIAEMNGWYGEVVED